MAAIRSMLDNCCNADDWYARGVAAEADSPAGAAYAYRCGLAVDDGHVECHVRLGHLLYESGQPVVAEAHFRRAIEYRPNDAAIWVAMGTVLEDLERYQQAEKAYLTALAIEPTCRAGHFHLAGLLQRNGDSVLALDHLAAYRRLNPHFFGP